MTRPGSQPDPLDGDLNLEELYEDAPCGYLSTRPDGTIVRVNAMLLKWLGAEAEDVVGRRFVELLTVPGRIYHDTHFAPLLAMQGRVREIALDLARTGAPPLPAIASASVKTGDAGQPVMHRIALFDCTQRRMYEQELLRARQAAERAATARDATLSMLSHDMRSPLSAILMAVELASATTDPSKLAKYHRTIATGARTVLDLVNAILEHSKLESGTAVWAAEPASLRGLAQELSAVFAVMAEAKSLRFVSHIDERLPRRVVTDRFKLGQIVTNLVSNAIKFTDAGEVRLSIRVLENVGGVVEVEISVADTGIGISAEHVASIFEEYNRASVQTAARYGGTGLGLAISQKLVALAGGAIEVNSRPGEGTRFSFVLSMPVVAEDELGVDESALSG